MNAYMVDRNREPWTNYWAMLRTALSRRHSQPQSSFRCTYVFQMLQFRESSAGDSIYS